jgi:O-antigen/teichoic acid export membrane protein
MSSTARQATRQRAARDVLLQVVTRVGNLALGVVVTALLARTLGNVRYGEWATLLNVLAIVGYFASLGMEKVVVREAAAHPEREQEWLGAMMLLRLGLLGPVIVLSLLAVLLLERSNQMLFAGLILVTAMPFDGTSVLGLVFQLRVNNTVPMVVLTVRSLLWAVAVAVVYWQGGGMVVLAIAMAATNAVGSIVQTVAALRILPRWPRPSRAQLVPLVRVGVPLAIAGMLIISYARIDGLIVYAISGSRAAGLYSAVYNVLDSSHFVPLSVLTTLTPIIAASWPAERERMLRVVRLAAELLSVASLGALAFAIAAATPLVRLIFGSSYVDAAPALPVLGAAFVFISFGYLQGNLLAVLGLQTRLMRISLVALAVNLVGNLILVPLTGFMGAAWMTLATEVVVCTLSLRTILRELALPLPPVGRVGRTFVAAVVLGAVLVLMRQVGAPLGALAAAACVGYPALLFGLRALAVDDLRVLLGGRTPV